MTHSGTDPGQAYLLVRDRLAAALAGLPGDRAGAPVPACPQWSVQQTVAHLSGACADLLAGRVQDAGSPAWTAAQVAAGAGRPVAELLADWAGTAPAMTAAMHGAPRVLGQVLLDALSHEYDLREALGLPAPEPDPALPVAVGWIAPRFVSAAQRAGFPPFRLQAGDRSWQYRECEEQPRITARWTELETLRALTGRLPVDRIRELGWDGDPGPWLGAFTWAWFSPARG